MRRRIALMSVERAIRSTPSKWMAPPLGSSSRLQQRSSVLLPEPDGPITNTSSCGATSRSMPRKTSVVPKVLRSARTWRIGEGTEITAHHSGAGRRPAPGIHNHDALGSIDRPAVMDPVLIASRCPGMTQSAALRLVLGRIVAGHSGHAVAREDRHGGGAGRRLNAEP